MIVAIGSSIHMIHVIDESSLVPSSNYWLVVDFNQFDRLGTIFPLLRKYNLLAYSQDAKGHFPNLVII